MDISELRELFYGRTADFFNGYEVVFTNQSRTAKPTVPLVTVSFGPSRRQIFPLYLVEDGNPEAHYPSRVSITVDLFTNGKPVTEGGQVVAYENSAVDELIAYCDYLNSISTTEWASQHNFVLIVENDTQDLTGVVNDNNYEYRARQEITAYYMHDADKKADYSGYFTRANVSYDILETEKEE